MAPIFTVITVSSNGTCECKSSQRGGDGLLSKGEGPWFPWLTGTGMLAVVGGGDAGHWW